MTYVSRHLDEIERFILRPADYSLSAEQAELRDVIRAFLTKQCSSELVRAAEPLGWDAGLWDALVELRLIPIALPEARGGDGGGLVELVLLAEEMGRAAAPASPSSTSLSSPRLLARPRRGRGRQSARSLPRGSRRVSLTVGVTVSMGDFSFRAAPWPRRCSAWRATRWSLRPGPHRRRMCPTWPPHHWRGGICRTPKCWPRAMLPRRPSSPKH